jgi:large subunit ribosomal protein L9
MKVILNKDLAPLGEEGDVKEVAKGYARNFLFPQGIAMPYTDRTVAILESRREEIEARKEEKRKGALGIKEKLEELDLLILMPAGSNGRLYGAVTSQTIADELAKQGFEIERKRIELPGNSFKSVGKYKIMVKLYESAAAELTITVEGQQLKVETPSTQARRDRRHRDESEAAPQTAAEAAPESVAEAAPEPAAETAPEPAAEAAPEPAAETAPEPVAEAAPEPAAETAPEPVAEAAPEPVAEAAPEPVAEAAPEPAAEAAPEPAAETAPESAAEPGAEENAPEPVREESAVET